MFPKTGYEIVEVPASYQPIETPSRRLMATPTPWGQTPGFQIPEEQTNQAQYGVALTEVGCVCLLLTVSMYRSEVYHNC